LRFQNLKLIAYGPFTDTELDFSAQPNGVQLIYGLNEAGKSSALRAIEDFLFGIPARTYESFVHPNPRLRIGAKLQNSEGAVLEGIRRKGNKNTLRQADDSTPIADAELQRLLGGVDRNLFGAMFGLGHERFRQGGEEIAQGQGKIGQMLFVAGAGLGALQEVQKKLQDDADLLFKSTGRSGKMLDDIKKYQDAKEALKNAQVSVDTWKRHDQAVRDAELEKENLEKQIRKLRAEQNRLSRISSAIPPITQWKKYSAELESLRDVPPLANDFAETSNDLLVEYRKAELRSAESKKALERITQQLEEISIPEELIAAEGAIESLRDRLGGYRKAMADRPGLKTKHDSAEQSAREILKDLGRAPELSEIEELRLPEDKTVRIQNLGNQKEGIAERLDSARQTCARLRRQITAAEEKISAIKVHKGTESLRNLVREVQQQGDLSSQLESLKTALEELTRELAVKIERLGLWSGTPAEAEELPVPSQATIDKFEESLRDATAELASLRKDLARESLAVEKVNEQLEILESQQAVPTQQQLNDARRLRDEGWRLLLAQWQDAAVNEKERDEFLEQFSSYQSLPDAYRRSVEAADQLADQLRSDAERVASKAKFLADRERHQRAGEQIEDDIKKAEATLKDLDQQWAAHWEPLGIQPLTPAEMRQWRHEQEAIAQLAAESRTQSATVSRVEERVESFKSKLAGALIEAGLSVEEKTITLQSLIALAENACDEDQKAQNRLSALRETLETSQAELAEAETAQAAAEEELKTWQADWSAEMQRIGLEEDALPAQANSVIANITKLFQLIQSSEELRIRIEGIDREASDFQADCEALLKQFSPDLATLPLEEAVTKLEKRLQNARSKMVEHETLSGERRREEEKLKQSETDVAEQSVALDEMVRQAHCESYEDFPTAARQSARRKELEILTRELEDQIAQQSGGREFEQFLREVESAEVDELQIQIEEFDRELAQIEQARDEVVGRIEREMGELNRIDGSDAAALLSATCNSHSAHLEEDLHELAVLRLSAAILREGIERHRENNQGPVLQRASHYFAETTGGAFERLQPDYNAKGEPVLRGVRSGQGDLVPIEGMSDGTCDQLYLSLRLASLENWLERHEPIPVIVDDILLNFDDERASAALKALQDLSAKTQVLFFTHHQHLVDLAQQCLSPEKLNVITLNR